MVLAACDSELLLERISLIITFYSSVNTEGLPLEEEEVRYTIS